MLRGVAPDLDRAGRAVPPRAAHRFAGGAAGALGASPGRVMGWQEHGWAPCAKRVWFAFVMECTNAKRMGPNALATMVFFRVRSSPVFACRLVLCLPTHAGHVGGQSARGPGADRGRVLGLPRRLRVGRKRVS